MATVSYQTIPSDAGPLGTVADLGALIGRVARKAPQLADRAERAGALLMAGKVHPVDLAIFEVDGSGGARYTVDAANFGCECADHTGGGAPSHNGARFCKHLLAALMLRHLTEQAIVRNHARRSRVAIVRPERPARVPFSGRLVV